MSSSKTSPSASGLSPMLTLIEVSLLVRKSIFSVRRMAKRGQLPGAKKIAGTWTFSRSEIERFIQ